MTFPNFQNNYGGCLTWCLGEIGTILLILGAQYENKIFSVKPTIQKLESMQLLNLSYSWINMNSGLNLQHSTTSTSADDFYLYSYCSLRLISVALVYTFIKDLRKKQIDQDKFSNLLLRNHFWYQLSLLHEENARKSFDHHQYAPFTNKDKNVQINNTKCIFLRSTISKCFSSRKTVHHLINPKRLVVGCDMSSFTNQNVSKIPSKFCISCNFAINPPRHTRDTGKKSGTWPVQVRNKFANPRMRNDKVELGSVNEHAIIFFKQPFHPYFHRF